MRQKDKEIMVTFSAVRFHINDEDENVYCVATFGSDQAITDAAELLGFDDFHEFVRIDKAGNAELSDGGTPFESVEDVTETLLSVFGAAIESGLVSEEALKGQRIVYPNGVPRTILS